MALEYSEKYIKDILQEIETIAVVGASDNCERDSYKVMESLIEHGYQIFPNQSLVLQIHNPIYNHIYLT